MNYRKVALILMLPFLLEPLVGCYDNDDYTHHYYRDLTHCGVSVKPIDNRGETPHVITDEDADTEFLEEAFGLSLWIQREESVDLCSALPARLSFFSNANALGPLHTHIFHYTLLDKVESIEIKTVNSFSSELPAGSDVTHRFAFREGFEYHSESEYIDQLPSEFTVRNSGSRNLEVQLFLMEPPGYASYFQFDVTIRLSDGRVLEATTNQFEVS